MSSLGFVTLFVIGGKAFLQIWDILVEFQFLKDCVDCLFIFNVKLFWVRSIFAFWSDSQRQKYLFFVSFRKVAFPSCNFNNFCYNNSKLSFNYRKFFNYFLGYGSKSIAKDKNRLCSEHHEVQIYRVSVNQLAFLAQFGW